MTKPENTAVASVPLEPGFFGEKLIPGRTFIYENPTEELALQLSSAALAHDAKDGLTTLYVATERCPDVRVALCTLEKNQHAQWNLTQTFSAIDGEVRFSCQGVNTVHLSGFVDIQDSDGVDEEPEDYDMYGDADDDSSSDDSMMQLAVEEEEDDDTSEDDEEDEIPDDSGRFEEVTDEQPSQPPLKDEEKVKGKQMISSKKEAGPTLLEAKNEGKAGEVKKRPLHEETKKEAKPALEVQIESKKAKISNDNKNKNGGNNNSNNSNKNNDAQKNVNARRQLKGGITIEDHMIGKGAIANKGRKVQILYKGKLASNGKQFDANLNRKHPFAFRLGVGDVIKGFDIGVEGMRVGGKRTVHIPSKMGYGAAGAGKTIPPNSDLVFEIELMNA